MAARDVIEEQKAEEGQPGDDDADLIAAVLDNGEIDMLLQLAYDDLQDKSDMLDRHSSSKKSRKSESYFYQVLIETTYLC